MPDMPSAEAAKSAPQRVPSRRERFRQATIDEIKMYAREQMAAGGPASLSLRAVARDMNITPSALYRYFSGIDDLITALCVDAYHAVGDAVGAAVGELPEDDHVGRWRAYANSFRGWALANPSDFALIYGTPLPGYKAPPEITQAAAFRYLSVALRTVASAVAAGAIDLERSLLTYTPDLDPDLVAHWDKLGLHLDPQVAAITAGAQVTVQGHLTLELFGHFNWLRNDIDHVWEGHLRAMMIAMGFDPQELPAA
uniref:TetR/AcrR family transcriptional regulator n=2 Tax=Thermocrispum agreste TaxID=37925 RepID=A0A2W4LUT1_9PSEU|nr:MAG: TetR/AcrR family transcriptional regulator [Thermocrispum agreste]